MDRSRFRVARRWLIFWTLFIGVGAVAGAAAMLIDPSGRILGMDAMLPYFQVLPFADVLFQDFVFSGAALLIVNGLSNLTAAALLLKGKKAGVALGGIFGITLMLWICIQFYMFPLNFMSTAYFIFGFAQAATGYAARIFQKQEEFHVDPAAYAHIGENGDRLVVFFSRMGYVKKLAYEAADRTGARVCEIRAMQRTAGTLGFWWCGRYGMHRWSMPIEPLEIDPATCAHVTVCSPIWVFGMAAPIRSFCLRYAGRLREADYILAHHTSGQYRRVAREMDALLGLKHSPLCSVQCRTGKMKLCTPDSAEGTHSSGKQARNTSEVWITKNLPPVNGSPNKNGNTASALRIAETVLHGRGTLQETQVMKFMYRLLIIEDDKGIAEAIQQQAEMWEMQVRCVENFRNVMAEFAAFDPHIVLLDISLPFFNGYHWCSEIRRVSKTPIIFISSAADNMNMIMAMNMGADDFIAKPFDQSLLIAKLQALLRRTYDFGAAVPLLEHRGALLNTGDSSLSYKNEKISLSKNEYRILLVLMENKGRVVSRERLMELLWETDSFVDENTLTVNVGRLRKRLDAAGLENFISTKFGVGYYIENCGG